MADINFTSNLPHFLDALGPARERALEIIGGKVESYAKELCPVGTEESTGIKGYRGGTLRNSITHTVEGNTMIAGSNTIYAPYVELGTGPFYEPPPGWIDNEAPRGKGIGKSFVHARPYLRPAVLDHKDEYKEIAKRELKDG